MSLVTVMIVREVNSYKLSKVVSFSISLMLTSIWGTDILFEPLTPQLEGWIWKTFFAHDASGVGGFMQSLPLMPGLLGSFRFD